MQKPKSLEQIANELAAKREPIKAEPKPKNTGGIDLSRAAGAINTAPNPAPKSAQNATQKPAPKTQNISNSRASNPAPKPEQNAKNISNSRIPLSPKPAQKTQNISNSRIPTQKTAPKTEPKIEPKPEPKNEPKDEKIIIKPKIATFRDDISALYETPAQNLSKTSLFIAFGIALLVMLATLPKVFIANEIYYTSRQIGTLRDKLGVLNEENRELKSKLEQIRYQNQVIDNLR